jgi:hypothetical protein
MNEIIKYRLISLIYDYVKNNRVLDQNFINSILDVVIYELELNDYIIDSKIINVPGKSRKRYLMANYDFYSRIIEVNLQVALERLKEEAKKLRLSSIETSYFIAKELAEAILHELEHAHQVKEYDRDGNNLESLIIKRAFAHKTIIRSDILLLLMNGYSEKELLTRYKTIKRGIKYYKYDPLERLADYHALNYIKEILKELNVGDRIMLHTYCEEYKNYIRGYKLQKEPTKFFLAKVGGFEYWQEIERLSTDCDLKTRLSLGLSITKDEYQELENRTRRLRKALK